MKETNYKCPLCGCNLWWNDTTGGELTDPEAARDSEDERVKDSLELRCRACWADVDVPEDLFDMGMVRR